MEKQLIGSRDSYEVWLGPDGCSPPNLTFEPYLYSTAAHIATQRPVHPLTVWLWDKEIRGTIALLRVDHDGAQVQSLPNAPFGGIESAPHTPPEALTLLLACLEAWCIDHHFSRLLLKAPPSGYGEQRSCRAAKAYSLRDLRVIQTHTNHHVRITQTPFLSVISGPERRRLRKCLRAGFWSGQWSNPDPDEVYAFLSGSRIRQGYTLPLNRDDFVCLLTGLPDSVKVFTVRDGHQVISLTVTIRVSQHILYNFCPADDLDYRTFSPAVMLNAALYAYAQREGIELMDLGVSLDSYGQEKASLIRFKENIGGQKSVKLTYEKIFKTP